MPLLMRDFPISGLGIQVGMGSWINAPSLSVSLSFPPSLLTLKLHKYMHKEIYIYIIHKEKYFYFFFKLPMVNIKSTPPRTDFQGEKFLFLSYGLKVLLNTDS